MNDDPGRGAVAGDRGPTLAVWRPAVGGMGEERRPWSGGWGRGPRGNFCGSAARTGWEMNACVLGLAQLRCLGQRRDMLEPRLTSSPQGGGLK